MEKWLPILDSYGFLEVSNFGRVRRVRFGLRKKPLGVLKGETTQLGYVRNATTLNRKRFRFKTHREVAKAFVPGFKPGLFVNHKDCNPLNNHSDNLEWVTPKKNCEHAAANGRYPTGSKHHGAKLTESQVVKIRNEYANGGISQRKLASRYGVNQRAIWQILNLLVWTHI